MVGLELSGAGSIPVDLKTKWNKKCGYMLMADCWPSKPNVRVQLLLSILDYNALSTSISLSKS